MPAPFNPLQLKTNNKFNKPKMMMSNLGMAVNKNPSREQIVAGIEDDDFLFTPKGVRESTENIK